MLFALLKALTECPRYITYKFHYQVFSFELPLVPHMAAAHVTPSGNQPSREPEGGSSQSDRSL